MAAESVGQIGLDLVVNQNQFNKQMSGITGLAKKAGAALAAAFAVKKIVDFGKACIELGSDLAEVQNVVDVTFPHMTKQVDDFAKNAAAQFGLSETMAKKFTGTFGAMAKAFGFSEKAAYDMGSTLTGLAGDVASFYNLSPDEAYTKLKSVFTGETESLKDLGVVMTQTALDSYALANGYGKVTSKMSEGEKVALRYAFVQSQLAVASGDFSRTSGSWANQVRILTLQFDSLKATIGQGLINVFTPVIRAINVLLSKLATVANAFKAFTELITGNKSSAGSGIADTTSGLEDAAGAASELTDNTAAAGKAAKKAAKDMKQISGIDKLNNMTSSDKSSGSGGSGGGSLGSAVDFGKLSDGDTVIDETNSKFQGLINKANELAGVFKKGFAIGVGDTSALDTIQTSLGNIKKNLRNIFTDKEVFQSASNLTTTLAESLGKISGSVASVGITIADNLIGGISKYFDQNSGRVKKFLIDAFDIQNVAAEIVGDFSVSIADIFTVFRSDSAKQITADIISVFANGFMGVTELSLKIGRDILDFATKPIIENKDKIKEALQGAMDGAAPIFTALSDFVANTFDKINTVYDKKIKPLIDSLSEGFSEILETLLDSYNEYIVPVLDEFSKKFKDVFEEKVQPAIDSVLEVFGDFADLVKDVWEKVLQPFIKWAIEKIVPVFAEQFKKAGSVILLAITGISDLIKGISKVFKGVIEVIKGIVNGDWKQVWQGCKTIISGIWDSIVAVFKTAWGLIKIVFAPVGEFFSGVWKGITGAFGNIAEWFRSKFSAAWEAVKKVFSSGGKVFDGIKEGILNGLKDVINALIGGINKVISIPFNGINAALRKIKGIEILGAKPFNGLLSEIEVPSIPKLAQGGYVKANTPQLAMIGDNRHQGEVVAPENKLQELLDKAVSVSSVGADTSILIDLMRQIISLLTAILGKEYWSKITSGEVANALLYENEKAKNKTGKPLLT